MSRREDHDRKSAEWLEHLQGWKDSGESVSAYARARHLPLWAMYHWRKILQSEGRWPEERSFPRGPSTSTRQAPRIPLRFARVAMEAPLSGLKIRVQLLSQRHLEIELDSVGQFAEVLEALERSA